eukprot:m.202530 g.202530  ORF g.202530 m.202530 type:complete len:233 (-) comp53838_c0_seq15:13-711(-)
MGSDICYTTIHGLGKTSRANMKEKQRTSKENIKSNFAQYGLADRLVDVLVADNYRCAWREGVKFDAIVTDPPYGIREGARKIAASGPIPSALREGHKPKIQDYSLTDVYGDLFAFACRFLVLGGHLVFFVPVIRAEYEVSKLPSHPCFRMTANSEQVLNRTLCMSLTAVGLSPSRDRDALSDGSLARRLVTLVKICELADVEVDFAASEVSDVRARLMPSTSATTTVQAQTE